MGGSNGMFDHGNVSVAAPYFIAGKSGTITALAAGDSVVTLIQFGMNDPRTPGALVATPIRISQVRIKYVPITTLTTGFALELHKGTATTVRDGGAPVTHLAKRRKTTGYPAIAATETLLQTAGTVAITGGNFATLDASAVDPIEMMTLGSGGFTGYESIWRPDDLCPLTLEQGEALDLRATNALTGTGVIFVAFDFLR